MKKSIFVCLLIITLLNSAFCFENNSDKSEEKSDWHFSIEPLFEIKAGKIGEYVFLKDCDYDDNKLSYLEWEMKPVVELGAKINGGWKGINISVYCEGGIPTRSGLMKDSDWLNVQYSGLEDYQYKTNYSESKNYLSSLYNVGVQAGYTFNLPNSFSLYPFAAFDFEYIDFISKGGTYWYGREDSSNGKTYYSPYTDELNRDVDTLSGKAVGYTRYSYFTWIGLSGAYNLNNQFLFDATAQIAPYVYAESIDEHYQTDSTYADVTAGFFCAFKVATSASYIINNRNSINLGISYFYLSTITGKSYQKFSDGYACLSGQDGGADEQYFSTSLSWKINIL